MPNTTCIRFTIAFSLWASIVSATTLRPIPDAELVRASQVIAVGSVRRIEALQRRDGRIVTEVTLNLEQIIKGRLRSRSIVLTQPGGRIGADVQWVYGVAEFSVGERAVVFARRGRDGRLRPVGMALGKYAVAAGPGPMATRAVPRRDARPLERFLAELTTLAATTPDRDQLVSSGRQREVAGAVRARQVLEHFTLLDTVPYRWFEPTVTFRVAGGDAQLGTNASTTALDQAMAVWSHVATAGLTLVDGGTTQPASQASCDNLNTIQFNDPFNEVDDLVGCAGVLAVGGFCGRSGTASLHGLTFHRIAEGDITVNDGFGACFTSTDLAEVLTHELGQIGRASCRERV